MTEATVAFIVGLALLGIFWWRLEVGSTREREVLLWFAAAAVPVAAIAAVAVFAEANNWRAIPPSLLIALALPLIAAVLIGLLRPHIVDVRALLVGSVVVVVVVTAYVAAFVGTWSVLELLGDGDLTPATFALIGAAWAGAVHPLRARLRWVVDQILFGARPDPLHAATKVADSVSDDPGLALNSVREALVLPYVELRAGGSTLASAGTPVRHTQSIALRLGADSVGELVVGLRPGDLRLSAADEQVLRLVAPLFAQTLRLRASREAAIAGIEDERRRLRRDLHDGLGPTLTGVAYAADAARNLISTDHAAADRQLEAIRASTTDAIHEIRRLVEGLRPPALDELGLVAALRQFADTLHIPVAITADKLPTIGAAVELAAYRIGIEALTNVVRHSQASAAELTLRVGPGVLTVEVVEEGGTGGRWTPGTGMTSMRERVDLVGGTLVADQGRVIASLPL